jgi:hypothetical protein
MMATAMHDPKPLRRLSSFDKKVGNSCWLSANTGYTNNPFMAGKRSGVLPVNTPVDNL